MEKVFLIMLACAVLHAGVSAQTPGDNPSLAKPQEATRKSEAQSPELLEAEKLNAQVIELYKAGKFDEATPLAKRVLEIREAALAPNQDWIVSALINLGEIYRARGKYGDAKIYFQRILAIYEQASTPDTAAMSHVLDILAVLNYAQFNYGESEKLYRRALALREQAGGPNNLQVATSLLNLAEFYRFRGEYKKAEPLYQHAIEIKGSALGPDDKDVVKALENYSCLYYLMNQWEKVKDIRSRFSFLRQKDDAVVDKGEVLNGKAISLPKPEYPSMARANRISGLVVIKVTIDEKGKVIEAKDMCAAHPALIDGAVQAALKAQFTPTLLSGAPVKVTGVITYRFVAQ
jgi:TonB family protein